MLKININNRSRKVIYKWGVTTGNTSLVDDKIHFRYEGEDIAMRSSEEIVFQRDDGSIKFTTKIKVKPYLEDGKWVFDIDKPQKESIRFDNIIIKPRRISPISDVCYVAECVVHGENYFVENRNISIKEFIVDDYSIYDDIKRCKGDNIVYDNTFLYTNRDLDDKNEWKYAFIEGEIPSNSHGNIYIGEDIYTAYTSFSNDGVEDNKTMLFIFTTEEDAKSFKNRCLREIIYRYDTRFWVIDNNTLNIKNSVSGVVFKDYLTVSVPTDNNFSPETFKENNIHEYIEKRKKDIINPPIDYERQQFIPFYLKDEYWKKAPVKVINFNLHFRQRQNFNLDDTSTSWEPDENDYWNNNPGLRSDNSLQQRTFDDSKKLIPPEMGDLLGDIGFTDYEIYHEANCIGKSFIRICFYDTPYRQTQNLLFYTTMFLNTSTLYGKYLKTLVNKGKDGIRKYNEDGEACKIAWSDDGNYENNLTCSFSASNKYDKDGSSEGFYLYMYPSVITNVKRRIVYMQVEFNHAKLGKRVLFSYPIRITDKTKKIYRPIDTQSENFPLNYYTIASGETGGYVNVDRLYQDMYIPVTLEYDDKNNQYIWYPNVINSGETLNFNLYEPRVNYGVEGPQFILTGYTYEDEKETVYNCNTKFECLPPINKNIKVFNSKTQKLKDIIGNTWFYGETQVDGEYVTFNIAKRYNCTMAISGTTIPESLFGTGVEKCLYSIEFNKYVTEICNDAFYGQTLQEIKFPEDSALVRIGKNAFAGNKKLVKIDLTNCKNLKEIDNQAFQGCIRVTELLLPENEKMIFKNGAFGRLRNLKTLYIPGGVTLFNCTFSRLYDLWKISNLTIGDYVPWYFENYTAAMIFKDCLKLIKAIQSQDDATDSKGTKYKGIHLGYQLANNMTYTNSSQGGNPIRFVYSNDNYKDTCPKCHEETHMQLVSENNVAHFKCSKCDHILTENEELNLNGVKQCIKDLLKIFFGKIGNEKIEE